MGKNKNKNKNKPKYTTKVSICTPTFNRRPFIKMMVDNIMKQTYPKDLLEWIIVDDGSDPIGDLVKDIPFVHYFYEEKQMDLGRKRNYMHEKCKFNGDEDIIVYIDDDDYYPPERISHAVDKLTQDKDVLCAGSSELYLWFNELNKMYKFGPYGPKHATAGTFAFKRKLLKDTSYEDSALLAEERHFLKNYTVPFVQLDPIKTILVISHRQNTFDKKNLIDEKNQFCNVSTLKPSVFIKTKEPFDFYINELDPLLENYVDGDISNKPKIIEEIDRKKELLKQAKQQKNVFKTNDKGEKVCLSHNELVELFDKTYKELVELKKNTQTATQVFPDGTKKILTFSDLVEINKQQSNEIKRLNLILNSKQNTLVDNSNNNIHDTIDLTGELDKVNISKETINNLKENVIANMKISQNILNTIQNL